MDESGLLGSGLGLAMGAATGNPLQIGASLFGLGMQIFGGVAGAGAAKQETEISQDEARQEEGINAAKQQQMELQAQRAQIENVRNMQRARAQGLNSAVNQGANFGSGLQGGQAQATDEGVWNNLGVSQGLQIGRQIAGFNQNITNDKIRMAGVQGTAATDAGIASLGGSLLKAAPVFGAFGAGIGGGSGGNYQGMPWSKNTGGLY